MAVFRMKSKNEVFTPKLRAHVGLRAELVRRSEQVASPETVPTYFLFGGQVTPFVNLTTPKGTVELTPGEVATLLAAVERYKTGQVTVDAARSFTLDVRLTETDNDARRAAAVRGLP